MGIEALSPQLTGIGRYTWELARRLPQVADVHDIRLFRENAWHDRGDHFLRSSQPHHSRIPRKLRRWLNRREFGRRLFHGPNFFFPAQAENALVTVHDLSVFRYPETHPVERLLQFEKEFQRSIDNARHIITDTNYIKSEMIELFGVNADRITAIPLGVSEEFFDQPGIEIDETYLDQHGLRGVRYCLCVATIEPRKGLDLAVKAFMDFRRRTRQNIVLVIVGASGWKNSDLHKLFESAATTGAVRFLGFVDDLALRALYRRCALFLYPSLYEGFGLPVLEALASSVPALISNRSCLPEVSGDVTMTVDVENHIVFRDAIEQALEDGAWRGQAVKDGVNLAHRLNWQRCAEETANVYRGLSD